MKFDIRQMYDREIVTYLSTMCTFILLHSKRRLFEIVAGQFDDGGEELFSLFVFTLME